MNNSESKLNFRNNLIANMTRAEELLTRKLMEDGRFTNKFEVQKIIRGYIVDFYFPEHKLIVELDGSVHLARKEKDAERTGHLEAAGYKVIRFANVVIYKNINKAIAIIANGGINPKKQKRKRSKNFLLNHVNKEIFVKRGSRLVRRKRNPAAGKNAGRKAF